MITENTPIPVGARATPLVWTKTPHGERRADHNGQKIHVLGSPGSHRLYFAGEETNGVFATLEDAQGAAAAFIELVDDRHLHLAATTPAPARLADLSDAAYTVFGGFRWLVMRYGSAVDVRSVGLPSPIEVRLIERAGENGAPSSCSATVFPAGIEDLSVHATHPSVADALHWAKTYPFAVRRAGSVTWQAKSAESTMWHAQIGTSLAEIREDEFGAAEARRYTIRRTLSVGGHAIELAVGDNAGFDEPRSIASFEQASAIAVSMTDYVLELMRTGAPAGDSGNAR